MLLGELKPESLHDFRYIRFFESEIVFNFQHSKKIITLKLTECTYIRVVS